MFTKENRKYNFLMLVLAFIIIVVCLVGNHYINAEINRYEEKLQNKFNEIHHRNKEIEISIESIKIEIQQINAELKEQGAFEENIGKIDALYEYILEIDRDVQHMWDVIE